MNDRCLEEMEIVSVEEADAEHLKQIASRCIVESVEFPKDEKISLTERTHQRIEQEVISDNSVFLKFLVSREILGFVLVKEYWNLSDLYVLPEYQGRGIGSLLLREALARCRSKAPDGHIWVNSSLNAEKFYRAEGFTDRVLGDRKPFSVPLQYEF